MFSEKRTSSSNSVARQMGVSLSRWLVRQRITRADPWDKSVNKCGHKKGGGGKSVDPLGLGVVTPPSPPMYGGPTPSKTPPLPHDPPPHRGDTGAQLLTVLEAGLCQGDVKSDVLSMKRKGGLEQEHPASLGLDRPQPAWAKGLAA